MHQRIDEDPSFALDLIPSVPPPRLGEIDLWDLDVGEDGGELVCRFLRTFLYYLLSPTTFAVGVDEVNSGKRMVTVTVYGPVADDGDRIYVRHTTTRDQCKDLITESERSLFSKELGRLGRIGINERLSKWAASTACSCLKLPLPPPGR